MGLGEKSLTDVKHDLIAMRDGGLLDVYEIKANMDVIDVDLSQPHYTEDQRNRAKTLRDKHIDALKAKVAVDSPPILGAAQRTHKELTYDNTITSSNKDTQYVCMENVIDDGRLRCLRCNHQWYKRQAALPEVCPKCKSPYWQKPRRTPQ